MLTLRHPPHEPPQIPPEIHDRKARGRDRRGHRPPAGLAAVEIVGIPGDGGVKPLGGGEEFTGDLIPVPEYARRRVIEYGGVDAARGVSFEPLDPDGIKPELRDRAVFQDVSVHPTDALEAEASGGREDDDQARAAPVRVEAVFKGRDVFERNRFHRTRPLIRPE